MEKVNYLEERLENQIKWYDKKSIEAQRKYKIFKSIEIIAASSIPVLSVFSRNTTNITWIIAVVGSFITIIESWLAITKYHENWIEYRSLCETLKHEKYMYLTSTGDYNSKEPYKLLVERVESIISKENLNWANLNRKSKGENRNE